MGSSTEAPRLRRRYRRNHNFSGFFGEISADWLHNAPTILSGRKVFDNNPPTCNRVQYLRMLRRLRSSTTGAQRRQIFNMLKTSAAAITSWLRREIATHLAQQALPRRKMDWRGEVASKTGILHRCQPSRNRAGNPAFWLISGIPIFLREHPAFLALFLNNKNR